MVNGAGVWPLQAWLEAAGSRHPSHLTLGPIVGAAKSHPMLVPRPRWDSPRLTRDQMCLFALSVPSREAPQPQRQIVIALRKRRSSKRNAMRVFAPLPPCTPHGSWWGLAMPGPGFPQYMYMQIQQRFVREASSVHHHVGHSTRGSFGNAGAFSGAQRQCTTRLEKARTKSCKACTLCSAGLWWPDAKALRMPRKAHTTSCCLSARPSAPMGRQEGAPEGHAPGVLFRRLIRGSRVASPKSAVFLPTLVEVSPQFGLG